MPPIPEPAELTALYRLTWVMVDVPPFLEAEAPLHSLLHVFIPAGGGPIGGALTDSGSGFVLDLAPAEFSSVLRTNDRGATWQKLISWPYYGG